MTVARSLSSYENTIAQLAAMGIGEPTIGKLLAGAIADPTSLASGAVQNTLYTLNTVNIPLSHLQNRAGKGLMICGFGSTAGNANAKDIIVALNATTLLTKVGATDNAKSFGFVIFLFRDAKDSQRGFGVLFIDAAVAATTAFATTEDEDADLVVTLQTQNTAAAAASATGKGLFATLLG